jgi:hypothetical protein
MRYGIGTILTVVHAQDVKCAGMLSGGNVLITPADLISYVTERQDDDHWESYQNAQRTINGEKYSQTVFIVFSHPQTP